MGPWALRRRPSQACVHGGQSRGAGLFCWAACSRGHRFLPAALGLGPGWAEPVFPLGWGQVRPRAIPVGGCMASASQFAQAGAGSIGWSVPIRLSLPTRDQQAVASPFSPWLGACASPIGRPIPARARTKKSPAEGRGFELRTVFGSLSSFRPRKVVLHSSHPRTLRAGLRGWRRVWAAAATVRRPWACLNP